MFHVKHSVDEIIGQMKKSGMCLEKEQYESLLTYYEELVEKNTNINLTAITEFDNVVEKHFIDSLAPLLVPEIKEIFARDNIRILDMGTGAGFPGMPIAIAFPELNVTLADSLNKRTAFLMELVKKLNLRANLLNFLINFI